MEAGKGGSKNNSFWKKEFQEETFAGAQVITYIQVLS